MTTRVRLMILAATLGTVAPGAAMLASEVHAQSGAPAEASATSDASTTPETVIHVGLAERAWRLGTLLEQGATLPAWWTDGYSLRLSGSGLSGPFGQPPAVLVDGLAMPASAFDRLHIDALPVSTLEVRSMTYSPGLQVVPGVPVGYGALHITTDRPPGTTLRGSVVLVNDTGDPGPDRYRSGGRNVDRSGPRATVRASVSEGPWFAEAGIDADEHHVTDDRIIARIRSEYDEPVPPVIRVFHPHGRVRYESAGMLYDVRAGHMRAEDFLFLDVLAAEWPNHQTWSYLSARGVRPIARDWNLHVTLNARDFDIESRNTRLPGPEPVSLRQGTAQTTLYRTWPTGTTSLHAGLLAEDAQQRDRFERISETRGFAGMGYERRLLSRRTVEITFDLDARMAHPIDAGPDPADASGGAAASLEVRTDRISLTGGLALRSEDRRLLSTFTGLLAAGFDPAGLGSAPRPAPLRTRQRSTETHLRLSDRSPPDDGTRRSSDAGGTVRWLELRVRHSHGLTVPDIEIVRLPDGIRYVSHGGFSAGTDGRAWQISAGLDWRPDSHPVSAPDERSDGLIVRLAASARGVLSGSERFRNSYYGLPPYAARMEVEWTGARFGTAFAARLEGPRTWRLFAYAPIADRPVQSRVDASVWKRIAGDAALLTFGIRNLLDTPYRVHPAGVDEQLSVRAGMIIRFRTADEP